MEPRDYIGLLRHRQLTEGWSDLRMARELGCSKTAWYYVVTGRREPGLTLLRRASRRFPEYDVDLMVYLRGERPLEGSGAESELLTAT